MEKKFVSVIIYLNDCEKEIERFLDTVIGTMQENFVSYELVCVDDACLDDTVSIIKRYAADRSVSGMISLVHMGKYQGIEPSMNAGRDVAIGDFVYEFDSVFIDYDPKIIMDAYYKLTEGYDIVGVGPDSGKRLFSRIFYGIYNRSNEGRSHIGTETFRIISRRAINRIKVMGDFIPYRKAVYANCGLETGEIIYKTTTSVRRKEKDTYQRIKLAMDSFIYFTNVLEKISTVVCVLFLITTVGFVTYALIDHIVYNNAIEGWTSLICFMSFGFFGVFLILTIILKYMAVMLNLVFRRQKYLVSSIEKVGSTK